MRIISKFHDYYDSALSHGIDPNLLYIRKEMECEIRYSVENITKEGMPKDVVKILTPVINILQKMPHKIELHNGKIHDINIDSKIIGFCGKIYLCFEINGVTFFDPETCITKIDERYLKDQFKQGYRIKREEFREILNNPKKAWSNSNLTIEGWNELKQYEKQHFDTEFVKLKCPIFSIKIKGLFSTIITLNPNLKKEGFPVIKTPTEAFQEISMFLGNQLVESKDPEPINVPDKYLVQKKGFNEWSFKRHKTESKKHKK